jgi:type VI secretion system protein ImpB
MSESVFEKKKRIRPPRVNITYDVEIGGAMVMKELPFVVGVISDLSGNPEKSLGKLKDRKFVEIDRDNFDEVLKSMSPRVQMRVENTLTGEGELSVELNFEKLSDFEPEAIVDQVEPLRKLLDVRGKLKDLQSRAEGNDRLEELLDAVIDNETVRDKLGQATGASEDSGSADEGGGDADAGGGGAEGGEAADGETPTEGGN